jgi:hypothetical protein
MASSRVPTAARRQREVDGWRAGDGPEVDARGVGRRGGREALIPERPARGDGGVVQLNGRLGSVRAHRGARRHRRRGGDTVAACPGEGPKRPALQDDVRRGPSTLNPLGSTQGVLLPSVTSPPSGRGHDRELARDTVTAAPFVVVRVPAPTSEVPTDGRMRSKAMSEHPPRHRLSVMRGAGEDLGPPVSHRPPIAAAAASVATIQVTRPRFTASPGTVQQ